MSGSDHEDPPLSWHGRQRLGTSSFWAIWAKTPLSKTTPDAYVECSHTASRAGELGTPLSSDLAAPASGKKKSNAARDVSVDLRTQQLEVSSEKRTHH